MSEEEKNKLLYERYTKCRDLELDRFWKNSVFVWVFLALCYGAFGKIIMDYLPNDDNAKISKNTYEIILTVISFMGFFMSKIWIWMARGLKAWYEVYESAVWDLESKSNIFEFDRKHTIENYWSVKTNGLSPFNSDRISPSRIVILIGRLMSLSWGVSFLVWLYKSCKCTLFDTFWPVWSFWGIVFGVIIVIWSCYCFVKSTTLRNSEEDKIYWEIKKYLYSKDAENNNTIPNHQNDESQKEHSDNTSEKYRFSNLYLSITDNNIEFFFTTPDERGKYEQVLTEFINKEFKVSEQRCLKCICKKIQNLFKNKNKSERDDILKFTNKEIIENRQDTNREQQSPKS